MKRSAANSWPRVTVDAAHPNCFKSVHSQGGSFALGLVGSQVVMHTECAPHNFWRLCQLDKANMVVSKNRPYEMKMLRQVLFFLPAVVILVCFSVFVYCFRVWAVQLTLSAVCHCFVTPWTAAFRFFPHPFSQLTHTHASWIHGAI